MLGAPLRLGSGLVFVALIWKGVLFPEGVDAEDIETKKTIEASLGSDGIQRATVLLDSYSYAPSHIIVQSGKPVELTLVSKTLLTPHNFVLKDVALGMDVDETVWGGMTEVVRFLPAKPGLYTFYCDKKLPFFPSHRDQGMEGTLEVK